MSVCYSPIVAFKAADGNIIFNNSEGLGIHELKLPCGQCIGCRLNHAESWAVRMVHEAQNHGENSFLTLTYSDEHLPKNGSLNYDDVTKFIKKLRKALKNTLYHGRIKYYRVGEYGENLSRPHYHVILFGFDFSYRIRYKGTENEKKLWRTKNDHHYFVSSFLTDLWGLGNAEIGDVNYNTCMYVAKYVTKKVNGKRASEHYSRPDSDGEIHQLEPEKSSMSRRRAIGREWIEKYWSDVYPEDVAVHDGKKLKTPKYYDKWLEKNNPTLLEQVKSAREDSSTEFKSRTDLSVSHEVKIRNQSQFKRELEGQSTLSNELDSKILQYNKDEREAIHKQRKKK